MRPTGGQYFDTCEVAETDGDVGHPATDRGYAWSQSSAPTVLAVCGALTRGLSSPGHSPVATKPFWTTKSSGLGVGLAICQAIATAHHGTMAAANNADGGATFRLALPLAPDARESGAHA